LTFRSCMAVFPVSVPRYPFRWMAVLESGSARRTKEAGGWKKMKDDGVSPYAFSRWPFRCPEDSTLSAVHNRETSFALANGLPLLRSMARFVAVRSW